MKYTDTVVTSLGIPEEVTLCFNINGSSIHCPECPSKHLCEDSGEELNVESLSRAISENSGITCVALVGGENYPEQIYYLAEWIKENTKLKVCWYSDTPLRRDLPLKYFDYVKTGSYKADLGGLDSVTTNQRFYKVLPKYAINSNQVLYRYLEDITFKFWKNVEIDETRNSEDDEE